MSNKMFDKNKVILETFHSLAHTMDSLKAENDTLRKDYDTMRVQIREQQSQLYNNHYIIVFPDEDTIEIFIKENINKLNNPTDDEIIKNYIINEYGINKNYEVIHIGMNKKIYL